jgi:LysR family transcriptional regulator, hypochlorite-specific transcription factor HypT
MDVAWLEDFLALVDAGNFNRASEARHCTQPAFSRRIRALEDWVGATLFNRDTHRVDLTEAGERFRLFAEEVLRRLRQGRDEARQAHAVAASTLKIAATHVLSTGFFPNWLYELEKRGKLGNIQLVSESMLACELIMQKGGAQFLLCHSHLAAPKALSASQFVSLAVGADRLVPVTAPTGDGKASFQLPGSALKPLPFLCYSGESGLGLIVELERRGEGWACSLETVFTSHLATLLRRMALAGRGIAWLPYSLIGEDIERGELVSAGGADWAIAVEVRLFRPRARLSLPAESFWSLVQAGIASGKTM